VKKKTLQNNVAKCKAESTLAALVSSLSPSSETSAIAVTAAAQAVEDAVSELTQLEEEEDLENGSRDRYTTGIDILESTEAAKALHFLSRLHAEEDASRVHSKESIEAAAKRAQKTKEKKRGAWGARGEK
jgi:hypothetical protein